MKSVSTKDAYNAFCIVTCPAVPEDEMMVCRATGCEKYECFKKTIRAMIKNKNL